MYIACLPGLAAKVSECVTGWHGIRSRIFVFASVTFEEAMIDISWCRCSVKSARWRRVRQPPKYNLQMATSPGLPCDRRNFPQIIALFKVSTRKTQNRTKPYLIEDIERDFQMAWTAIWAGPGHASGLISPKRANKRKWVFFRGAHSSWSSTGCTSALVA